MCLCMQHVNQISLGFTLGRITSNRVSFLHSTLATNPPTVTVVGVTKGGPPTAYTWRRNGVVITNEDTEYNISISVTADSVDNRQVAGYTSTLVTPFPGVYQYSVTNRAMNISLNDSITIQGNPSFLHTCALALYPGPCYVRAFPGGKVSACMQGPRGTRLTCTHINA